MDWISNPDRHNDLLPCTDALLFQTLTVLKGKHLLPTDYIWQACVSDT